MTQTRTSVEVHTICWNEERLLPLFLSHYARFATKIVVWDNHSDDASPELVRRCSCAELRSYDSNGRSSEDRYLDVKNHCWKGSQSDWVIVCDVDELIYHSTLLAVLDCSNAEVVRCDGFNVCGPLTRNGVDLTAWRGKYSRLYSKPAVFRPTIGDIRYAYGCHRARPSVPIAASDVKLLHCHFLGSADELIARYRRLAARKSPRDFRRGLSRRYLMSDEQIRAFHRRVSDAAYPFSTIDVVRELQRTGMPWVQIVGELQSCNVVPPVGQCEWTIELARSVFGEN